ncbi:energy transducer TonB [Mucilaginibacter sp. FT3.2]|uniref:energy transducer TonB n=1 Tax=Mucilaginibacter sp. FT3.2 TaxID=2723090 RepID=UPI00161BA304|nr:energy transducer TonB [Mucilaginibacter sp. FT3.2]MBB6230490.1 protein TonB [Mucilaginibacter sp. FT3.2]
MRKILLIAIVILTGFTVKAQNLKADTSRIFDEVDKLPEFTGGADAFKTYVNSSLKKAKRKDTTAGLVVVTFVVEKNGALTNPKATMSFNPEADAIAIKVISKSLKWKPGIKDGNIVRTKFSVAVRFGEITDGPPDIKELAN